MFQGKRNLGNPYGDDTIDVMDLVKKFTKRWKYFAVGLVLAGAWAFWSLRSAERIYRVKASIILNSNKSETTSFEAILRELQVPVGKTSGGLENEMELLQSYSLVKSAVSKMDVGVSYYSEDKFKTRREYKDVPFEIAVDSTQEQLVGLAVYIKRLSDSEYRVRAKGSEVRYYNIETGEIVREIGEVNIDESAKVGEKFDHKLLHFTVNFKDDWDTYTKEEYYFKINTLDGLAGSFKGGLVIEKVNEEANIINLVSDGPLVEVEKKFINQLIEEYKATELEKKRELGERTVETLEKQLGEITGELQAKNDEKGVALKNSPTLNAETSSSAIYQRLGTLKTELRKENVKLQYYKELLQNIDRNPNNYQLPSPDGAGINSNILSQLIIKLSNLGDEKAKVWNETTESSPLRDVTLLKIKTTRQAIRENVASSINSTQLLTNELRKEISQLTGEKYSLPKASLEIDRINQESEQTKELYQYLQENLYKAQLALETITIDLDILDSPKMDGNKPIAPKKSFFVLLTLVVGLGIPAVVIVIRDFFDKKIGTYGDIQSSTNIPVLGFIARHDRTSDYIVPKDSRTALAESFRSIRIKLEYLNEEGKHRRVIGLTSSSSGEGKTFCSTNLAAVIAQAGKRTLLIDIDLRRPRVTRYFENGDGRGLSSYLVGEVDDMRDLIHKTHIENLEVIHSGPVCSNPLDLIATDKMKKLMATFRDEYDHIVLDTPPVGLVSDYLVIMTLTDYNVYVVRDSTTDMDSLRMINELYDSEKIKNVGILINDVKSLANYGYIDKYYGYNDA